VGGVTSPTLAKSGRSFTAVRPPFTRFGRVPRHPPRG
jgi:hypothetical protein